MPTRPFYQAKLREKVFLLLMISLVVTLIVDTSIVKINDLVDRYFVPFQTKLLLFSVNSIFCMLLQFLIIKSVQGTAKPGASGARTGLIGSYKIFGVVLFSLSALIGFLIFEQAYFDFYETWISILIIAISYSAASGLIIWLSLLFLSWYRTSHNRIVFLYFVSMSIISFNLIMTSAFVSAKVSDRPPIAVEYIGSSGDISSGRHLLLENFYQATSFASFFSIWLTTAILMKSYRERLLRALVSWIILGLPFVYFLLTYFHRSLLGAVLEPFARTDPLIVLIVVGIFLSLSKPMGGLVFGIAFWKISRIVSYEKNIRTYMTISGWGIFLVFSANQAAGQVVNPYPPFGLATITALVTGAYFMLLGIYNSAVSVSTNNLLRGTIYRRAMESRLLGIIGQAEMESEIERVVKSVTEKPVFDDLEKQQPIEVDKKELKNYLDFVMKEVKKGNPDSI